MLPDGSQPTLHASDVICSLPPQSLPALLPDPGLMPDGYRRHLDTLHAPSGAIVFYGALERRHLPPDCPGHLQRDQASPGSLFLSVSHDGDGRAPEGRATVIASVFTSPEGWHTMEEEAYQSRKQELLTTIRMGVNAALDLPDHAWLHQELATPRGFARWTGRPQGIVGGLGQSPDRFGPFGRPAEPRWPISGCAEIRSTLAREPWERACLHDGLPADDGCAWTGTQPEALEEADGPLRNSGRKAACSGVPAQLGPVTAEDRLLELFKTPAIGGERLEQGASVAGSHGRSQSRIAPADPSGVSKPAGCQLLGEFAHARVPFLTDCAQQSSTHHHGQVRNQRNGLVVNERFRLNPMRAEGHSQRLTLLRSIRVRSGLGGSNPRTSTKQARTTGFHPRLCGSSHRMRRHKTGMPIPPDIQHRPFHRPHIGHNGGVRQRLHQQLRRAQQSLQGQRQNHHSPTLKTGWITTDGIHQTPGHALSAVLAR